MSKDRMKEQGTRDYAQNHRGGQEANPKKDKQGAATTKRGEKAKNGNPTDKSGA